MKNEENIFIEQLEIYLSKEDYAQALPIFKNILLPGLLDLSKDLIARVLSHAHTLMLHLL